MGFAMQPSLALPEDVSNSGEWFTFFFDNENAPAEIPHNRYPRVAVTGSVSKEAQRLLQEYIDDFCEWADDVMACLVWEEIRRCAQQVRLQDNVTLGILYETV